jgi:aryl-alcohol dehydrogenase-like predicted oxidoreductase
MAALPHRSLGGSELEVSIFALGSWQTYERIPRDQGVAVLQAARECGIDLLEVARYNDTTGRAPIPTGYSEVVFGEVFRASGWPRDEVTIANKLWWEFWPRQTAAEELDASLQRTGLDHFDFVYSDPPPDELAMEEVVRAVADLVAAGKARAWGSSTGRRSGWPRPGGSRASSACRRRARRSFRTAWSRVRGSRTRR